MTGRAALLAAAALLCAACGGGDEKAAAPPEQHLVFDKGKDVWIADADGANPRKLVRGSYGLVSPNGRTVAFQRGGIHLVASDGSGARRLADGEAVDWVSDDQILVLQEDALATVEVDDGQTEVVAGGIENHFGFDLSPDRSSVVWSQARGPENRFCQLRKDLYVAALDGEEPRRITNDGRSLFPMWGDRAILFSYTPKGGCFRPVIRELQPDGSGARPVVVRPSRSITRFGFYGLRPYYQGGSTTVLGIRTEWGDRAAVLRKDRSLRELGFRLGHVSRDGRHALGVQGAAEFPFTMVIGATAGGRPRAIASGRITWEHWNR